MANFVCGRKIFDTELNWKATAIAQTRKKNLPSGSRECQWQGNRIEIKQDTFGSTKGRL